MNREIETRVRERAYQLWQTAGAPVGNDQHFWYQAVQEIQRQNLRQNGSHRPITITSPGATVVEVTKENSLFK